MPNHPTAFVDESWLQQRGSPGAYLMAAVIIDQDDVAAAEAAASAAAGIHDGYHSTVLYHRGHVGTIEAMLDVVSAHAGWSVVSAQVPLNAGTRDLPPHSPQHARSHLESQREHARQVSLERLLRYLNSQRVRDVYLESRASPAEWQQARDAGSRLPSTDRNDIRAYRRLLDQGTISHRMRLIHVDGRNDQDSGWPTPSPGRPAAPSAPTNRNGGTASPTSPPSSKQQPARNSASTREGPLHQMANATPTT